MLFIGIATFGRAEAANEYDGTWTASVSCSASTFGTPPFNYSFDTNVAGGRFAYKRVTQESDTRVNTALVNGQIERGYLNVTVDGTSTDKSLPPWTYRFNGPPQSFQRFLLNGPYFALGKQTRSCTFDFVLTKPAPGSLAARSQERPPAQAGNAASRPAYEQASPLRQRVLQQQAEEAQKRAEAEEVEKRRQPAAKQSGDAETARRAAASEVERLRFIDQLQQTPNRQAEQARAEAEARAQRAAQLEAQRQTEIAAMQKAEAERIALAQREWLRALERQRVLDAQAALDHQRRSAAVTIVGFLIAAAQLIGLVILASRWDLVGLMRDHWFKRQPKTVI